MKPFPGKQRVPTDLSVSHDPERRRLLQGAALTSAGLLLPSAWSRAPVDMAQPRNLHAGGPLSSDEDAWNAIREALLGALNLVPAVGGVLSYVGALFIPGAGQSAEQRWRAYTDARISDAIFRLIKADLEGLSHVARLYRDAVASGDAKAILSQSIAANTGFVAALPRFQLAEEREALLPLFAIAASLHLALLRDMVLSAETLGMARDYRQQLLGQQKEAIRDYTAYVDREADAVYDRVRATPGTPKENTPLSQLLVRRTRLQLDVLDQRDTWYAFDAEKYPGRVAVVLDREIHTGIIGRWDGSELPRDRFPDWTPPASPLHSIEVTRRVLDSEEVAFLDGVRMEYANGDVLESGQLAERSPPFVLASGESITSAVTHFRTIQGLVSIELQSSGARSYKVAGRENGFDLVEKSLYEKHQLSSIRPIGRGKASAHSAAGCYVLGFQLAVRGPAPLDEAMLQRIGPVIAPQLLDWIRD